MTDEPNRKKQRVSALRLAELTKLAEAFNEEHGEPDQAVSGENAKFMVTFDAQIAMDVYDIWPDGDAPEKPTAADVIKAIRGSHCVVRFISDWRLEHEIHVSVDGEPVKW